MLAQIKEEYQKNKHYSGFNRAINAIGDELCREFDGKKIELQGGISAVVAKPKSDSDLNFRRHPDPVGQSSKWSVLRCVSMKLRPEGGSMDDLANALHSDIAGKDLASEIRPDKVKILFDLCLAGRCPGMADKRSTIQIFVDGNNNTNRSVAFSASSDRDPGKAVAESIVRELGIQTCPCAATRLSTCIENGLDLGEIE